MKRILLSIFACSSLLANGQYLQKDFNDISVTSGGWTTQVVVGSDDWAPYNFGGEDFARITNWNGSSNDPAEAWLISPSIDLSVATAPELTFINAYDFAGAPLEVFISTNYSGSGAPSAATWSPLTATLSSGGFNWVSSGAIDLSSYMVSGVYIGFKYTGSSSDGSTWEIDDILVDEPGAPPSLVSIYDIQYTTASPADSPYDGQTVMTAGIVTAAASTGYWIQDGIGAWNGVYVYDGTNTPAQGDSVVITGDVSEFNGLTEISNVSSFSVATSGNSLPFAATIATDTTIAEQYEGVLVITMSSTCTNPSAGFGQWIIDDGSGEIFVDDMMYAYTPTISPPYYIVQGPLHYSFDEWKIEPRDANDISVSFGIEEQIQLAIRLYPNPVADQLTLTMDEPIEGAIATIYAVDGRLVKKAVVTGSTTLLDVSELTNGIYDVVITGDQTIATNRFIKQ